jgi:hypothetical protein
MLVQKHQDPQSLEQKKLAQNQKKCLNHPKKLLGIVMDGMDEGN